MTKAVDWGIKHENKYTNKKNVLISFTTEIRGGRGIELEYMLTLCIVIFVSGLNVMYSDTDGNPLPYRNCTERNVISISGLNVMCSDSDGNPLPYGNYEDTNNCRMFYMCFMGVGFHQHCAAGTVFDPSTESCSFYDEGQC